MHFDPKGYRIRELVYASRSTLVYRAVRERDQHPVILKVLDREVATPGALARWRHEFEVLRALPVPGVVKVLDMETVDGLPMLVLEDFAGESLAKLYHKQRLGLEQVLALASRIADILGQVHDHRVIHCDINPSNILLNQGTGELKIADFGHCVRGTDDPVPERQRKRFGGTLAYMSPEQTGRMNRPVDYRTDLYSLGVTLYELCAGEPPFAADDVLELVHSHLARQPMALNEVDAAIPAAVSDIITKLMAKMPEDRYQSARGLFHDIEECRRRFADKSAIAHFSLGEHDHTERFQIPTRLVGREQEIEVMGRAVARMSDGARQLLLMTGAPGAGKSALARELARPERRGRSYFIAGKFDQYQRNVPYSALARAFSALVSQLLTEPEDWLHEWRRALHSALGPSGQVLVDVIPELAFLIGPQPAVPRLGPVETENRFNHVFRGFLEVLCTAGHPLVVCLDDLQWADAASLRVIRLMLTDPGLGHLLIIGAYRDGEVDAAHPLTATLAKLAAEDVAIERIAVNPLGRENVRRIVADTLQRSPEDCTELADLVLEKTAGNPFFVGQFLHTLHQDGLLVFDRALGGWRWDIEAIRGLGITDSVVELMVERMRRLPAPTQRVLRIAACAGNTFDVEALAILCEDTPEAVREHLAPALEAGLILSQWAPEAQPGEWDGPSAARESLGFAHDRVQQAAYALIADADKAAAHVGIVRLYARALTPEETERRVFEIAEHIVLGAAFINELDERLGCARLCLAAGRRATEAMAHESARRFLRVGLGLMPPGSWDEHHALIRDLAMATVEAEYLNADVEAATELSETILTHARDLLDKVAVHDFQIQFHIARNEMGEAMEVALATLSLLGVDLPRDSEAMVAHEQALRQKLRLDDADFAAIEHLPVLSDAHQAAVIHILNRASTPTFFTDPLLWKLMVLTMVDRCLDYGHSSLAAMAYGQYGALLCGDYQDPERGSRFGALALRLVERFADPEIDVKVRNVFYVFVLPWNDPAHDAPAPLRDLVQRGLQTGDLEFGLYCGIWGTFFRLFVGEPLAEVHAGIREHMALIERYRMVFHGSFLGIWERLVAALLGQVGPEQDPVVEATPYLMQFECYSRTVQRYVMGDYPGALAAAQQGETYAAMGSGMMISAEHNAFCSLALLAALPDEREDTAALLDTVAKNQSFMTRWAERNPENFAHKHALVEAEWARVRGDALAAMARYDEAIASARGGGYLREEALACERAAGFYASLDREPIANMYLSDAYRAYRQWGALAKVHQLENRHPWLFRRHTQTVEPSVMVSPVTMAAPQTLDLTSVVRASQALSSHLVLDALSAELMKIIIENAGAQRGYLLLLNGDSLKVEAEGDMGTGICRALPSLALHDPDIRFAHSVVSYVARTQKSLVLGDAEEREPFAQDPYVQSVRPRSLLCAPIARHGELVGVIYLENNLVRDAFTPGRVDVVQMLATQAAISIENARLLEHLKLSTEEAERANRAKSEFLANMNHELRTPMNGIIGTIELLFGTEVDEEQQNYLTIAKTAAEQLMRIIRDTLDLSRIEAGKLELDPIRFLLSDCMAALVRMLKPRLQTEGQVLELHVSSDVPGHLVGDRDRLLQVLINLLGNATKFTPEGGTIAIRVRALSRDAEAIWLRFEVRDTGIGISAEEQRRIFQPFVQSRSSGLGAGGSGLGLAIAASLVEMMEGRIGVESELGQGSCFWFTSRFGLWQPEQVAPEPAVVQSRGHGSLRILIAEDNKVNQLVAARLLAREGHDCVVAANGVEALHLLETAPFDAVLMDVHMPIMDGHVATREIRRREQDSGRHIPIIALTASATTEVVAQCMASGMDHYLSKPLRIEAVRSILRSIRPQERIELHQPTAP